MIYFDKEYAIKTHDEIIAISGGKSGIIHEGLLESILDHVQNDVYYPDTIDKLTHLVFSINKNHCFADGNKRTSIALGEYFLYLNGYDYILSVFATRMETVAIGVADNIISKLELQDMLMVILEGVDYTEYQKLLIIKSLQVQISENIL